MTKIEFVSYKIKGREFRRIVPFSAVVLTHEQAERYFDLDGFDDNCLIIEFEEKPFDDLETIYVFNLEWFLSNKIL